MRSLKHVVLAIVCGLSTQCIFASTPYIFGRADFATGSVPYAIVTADFNGDGILDLAVANYADNTVSIFLGKPDGSFTRSADYVTGTGPNALAVGDFNGDGYPDLAVTNQNCNNTCGATSVAVFLSKGNGTFFPATFYNTDTDPVSVVVGDFNGDGTLDLAVANAISTVQRGPGEVSVYLNYGEGAFRLEGHYPAGVAVGQLTTIRLPSSPVPSVAVTNFVSTSGVNAISILRNQGDGTFAFPVSYVTGQGPVSVAAADFNQDGILDLSVVNAVDNSVSIFLGRNDGSFAPKVDYPVASGPHQLVTTDLNRDGNIDLVIAASTTNDGGGAISILLGCGDGTFRPSLSYGTGNNPWSLATGDFNRNGKVDVAFTNGDVNRFSVLLGNGDGTFPSYLTSSAGFEPIAVAAGDFNGDGCLDLAVADYGSNSILILFGTCNGNFVVQGSYPVGENPSGVAVADLNGDGKLDIVVANTGDNTVSILLNDGSGRFSEAASLATGNTPEGIAIADLNEDHLPDLAVTNSGDNTVSILLNLGGNHFGRAISYATGPGPTSIVAADFNGDGKFDLAVANYESPLHGQQEGYITVLLNHGDGTFNPGVDYQTGPNPTAIAVADFNGDGRLDLAVASNLDVFGVVSVFFGAGDGSFQHDADYHEGFGVSALAAGDINADGKADLAVVSSLNNTVFLLRNSGDGIFQIQGTYGTAGLPVALAVGNFATAPGVSQRRGLVVANFSQADLSMFINKQY